MKFIEIKRKTFGRLRVLHRGPNDQWGNARWYVRCICGKKTLVWGSALRRGTTTSCGCWRKECHVTHGFCKNHKNTRNYQLWQHAKQRANQDSLVFTLKPEDIVIPKKCPVFGVILKNHKNKLRANTPTLDRIIPRRGYTKDNVWVICYRANRLKNDATLVELKSLVKALSRLACS